MTETPPDLEVTVTTLAEFVIVLLLVIMCADLLNRGTQWCKRRDRKKRLDDLYPPR